MCSTALCRYPPFRDPTVEWIFGLFVNFDYYRIAGPYAMHTFSHQNCQIVCQSGTNLRSHQLCGTVPATSHPVLWFLTCLPGTWIVSFLKYLFKSLTYFGGSDLLRYDFHTMKFTNFKSTSL